MASNSTQMTATTNTTKTVKTYGNLLDAHTAFVLDRYSFMENIQHAVLAEDVSGSLRLFGQLREGNFVELIAGLLSDPDERNREQAFYTLANLLALENQPEIVQRTKTALLGRLQDIFHNLYAGENHTIQKTCAYVVHNLAMVFARRDWRDLDKDEDGLVRKFCDRVLDAYNGLYGSSLVSKLENKSALRDMLAAVAYVSAARPFGPRLSRVLADMLGAANGNVKPLLDMLNNRLSESEAPEGFIPADYHGEVLDRFLLLLSNDTLARRTRTEALWGLSNFVVEAGVAEKLAGYDELLDFVVEDAIMSSGFLRAQALWVLGNMIAKVQDESVQQALIHHDGVWNAIVEGLLDANAGVFKDATIAKVLGESVATVSGWRAKYEPEDEEESDDEEEEQDEEEYDEYTKEDEDNANMDEIEAMINAAFPPAPNVAHEEYIPTALDLILEGRCKPSETVRRLVRMVQETGYTQWTLIPENTSLTVEELTTLQLMGYVIVRGYISVNPVLLGSL